LRSFDRLFRKSCCHGGSTDCLGCHQLDVCAFHEVFSQELSSNPDIVRRHQKPSLPYVFKIEQNPERISEVVLTLVILGNAINHLNHFFVAVKNLIETSTELCSGHDAGLTAIYCLDYQNNRYQLDLSSTVNDSLIILSAIDIMESVVCSDQIRLIIDSPLRLMSAGKLQRCFDFSSFMCSQLRRCSSMSAYYGEGEISLDFQLLAKQSRQVECIKNDITINMPFWTQRANNSGLSGTADFIHISSGLLPLLILGSYLNAGKGATVGFGSYRVEML